MKKKDEQELHEMLSSLLERNFSEDELAMIAEQMKRLGEHGFSAVLDEAYYTYQRPDYSKMCQPVELYLFALYHAKTTEELLALLPSVTAVTDRLSQEEREQAVRNMLLNILADFYGGGEERVRELAMLGALRLMEKYDMTALNDTLLELLRQNAKFTELFVECNDALFSLLISKLFRNDLIALQHFVREEGLLPNGQAIAADAVIQMALDDPQRRDEVIGWVNALLAYMLTLGDDAVTPNIDHIAASLLQMKAVETLPLLKECYEKLRIPEIELEGGYRQLKKDMAKGCGEWRVECSSVEEFLKMYVEHEKAYKEREEDDEDDALDKLPWDDGGLDDDMLPLFLHRDKPLRRLTISVTLDDAPVEVSRELTVPSTLRLSHFAEVLIRAMGWMGAHLSIFERGKEWYGDSFSVEQWQQDGMERVQCYDDFTVGDLLSRKGSSMVWEYDLGDSWRHTLRVEKSEPGGKSPYEVTLNKAKGACPPEDCGGVWGYAHLIEIMADPEHPEHEDYKEWLGHKLQPGRTNIAKARKAIKNYLYVNMPY